MLPKFNVRFDRKLDEELFLEFFNLGHPMVFQTMPQIKTEKDVLDALNYAYDQHFDKIIEVIEFLKNNAQILHQLANIISQKLDIDWGDAPITIIPATCPIAPRWIKDRKFMVPYYWAKSSILRVCVHEMTHFLYFDKLNQLLPNEKIDTENPSLDWLLSEIVVLEFTNSPEVLAITNENDQLFMPKNLVTEKQVEEIRQLFQNTKNLNQFRIKALEILKKAP